jgi:hypothetical protein
MKEVWKDIPGYEDIYQASTHGRIRTVEGKRTYSIKHGERTWKSRILKYKGHNPQTGNRVSLWRDKQHKDYLVARLIGFTFLGIPVDEKMTINHKDGNRFNNKVENLEWLSLADNIRHAFENDLMPLKPVTLVDSEGHEHMFKSRSQASRYLGHNEKYISNAIKRHMRIYDTNKNEYTNASQ